MVGYSNTDYWIHVKEVEHVVDDNSAFIYYHYCGWSIFFIRWMIKVNEKLDMIMDALEIDRKKDI